MKTKSIKQQSGFSVLTLLIAAVAIFGVLSAVVSMSRSGASVSGDSLKPIASAILTQGNNLATAYQGATSRGLTPSEITYNNTADMTKDLLNPANTGLAPQVPPSQAFAVATTTYPWVYKQNAGVAVTTIPGVGVTANADYAFTLGGLSASVCTEINKQLGVTTTSAALADAYASGVAIAAATTAATAIDLSAGVTAGTGIAPTSLTGMMQGCVKATDGYFFYVVVQPQ